jgi:phosphoribosylanthranilate isomerase
MRRPWVKVCGLTREEDVAEAVSAGADAVGLVFAPESPRHVDPVRAARLVRAVPPQVARVGVTVSLSPAEAQILVRRVGLTAIQAHGEESADTCRAYGVPVVKAFRTGAGFDLGRLEGYGEWPVLLDGLAPGARGGTGRPADWEAARRAREGGWRVLLAGGLGPENLVEAIRRVHPVAIDLNSGVETEPGIKDGARIRAALECLRGWKPPAEETWPW